MFWIILYIIIALCSFFPFLNLARQKDLLEIYATGELYNDIEKQHVIIAIVFSIIWPIVFVIKAISRLFRS